MEDNQLREKQVELLIRDGFASEVYFGDLEGEYLDTDEIEDLSPILLALRSERSVKGYKTMLFYDALARQFEYYLEYSDNKNTGLKNTLIYIKPPLYIPGEIVAKMNDIGEASIIMAGSKEEEDTIRKGLALLKELHDFHNDRVITAFCDYISAQGVIADSSPKQFFLKAMSNKKEALALFDEFQAKIVLHKELIGKIIELLKMDKILSFINGRKMANAVLKSTEEENNRMESFLSKKLQAADSRFSYANGEKNFYFSPLAFERPSCDLNFLLPLNFFTFADLMLYSEMPLEEKDKEEKIAQIRIFHEVYHNNKFKDEISEILLIGEKYTKAYISNGVGSSGDEVVKKTYQHEAYESFFDNFSRSVKTYSKLLFETIVKKEKEKPSSVSIFSSKGESFSFVLAGYAVKQAIMDKLSMLPLLEPDSYYHKLQKTKTKLLVSSQIESLVSIYVEARTEYLRKVLEEGKEGDSKEDNKAKKTESANDPKETKEDPSEDNNQGLNATSEEVVAQSSTNSEPINDDMFNSYADDDEEEEEEDDSMSSKDKILENLE